MQRWEYCEVRGWQVAYLDKDEGWRYGPLDGYEPKQGDRFYASEEDKARVRTVARLGLEGWEIYDVYKDDGYRMKRPITDDTP
jgi:hypothetical protein